MFNLAKRTGECVQSFGLSATVTPEVTAVLLRHHQFSDHATIVSAPGNETTQGRLGTDWMTLRQR